ESAIHASSQPDTGIWEFRTLLRHYTFSLAMCWVAVHRGAILANSFGEKQIAAHWSRIADDLRNQFLERGYNARLGYFTQSLDGEHPDASNLLLPSLGIVDA